SPSMSDLSQGTSCCGTELESPDCPTVDDDWAKSSKRKTRPRPRRSRKESDGGFRSHEKYFEHKMYVFGHKYSSKYRTRERLWAGEHSFPFHYTLPNKLPASFHGRLGYVRYFCEATLERSASPNILCRTMFSVNNLADVNNDPKADSGVSEQRSTNSCLFCCKKGTIIVSANLKKRAFVPGEDIILFADILNMSNAPINRSCVKLVQVVTYFSSKGFRNHVDEAVISHVYRGKVPCGESDTWEGVRLKVPPLPPTSKLENFCKLMEIDYPLWISDMPLLIGTVPLQREFCKLQQEPSAHQEDDVPSLLHQNIQTKYSKLPAVFSGPCVWGARPIEMYYYRQVSRRVEAPPVTDRVSQVVLAPHQREKVFTPRYVCYRSTQAPSSAEGFAHGVPQIVITQHPNCLRHNHLPPTSRRHSAPGHIMGTPRKTPSTPLDTPIKHILSDIPEVK
ncbi:hypothetical protein L9F63_010602, partial [Diploptera punctata]